MILSWEKQYIFMYILFSAPPSCYFGINYLHYHKNTKDKTQDMLWIWFKLTISYPIWHIIANIGKHLDKYLPLLTKLLQFGQRVMITDLYIFFPHMFVNLYFLKYGKEEPFVIVWHFPFDSLVGIFPYLPWKTNCYSCVWSLECMRC